MNNQSPVSSVIQWSSKLVPGEEAECTEDDNRTESLYVIPIMSDGSSTTEYVDVRIKIDGMTETKVPPTVKTLPPEDITVKPREQTEIQSCTSPESQELKCFSCSKIFTTKQHLERHSNLHSMETLYSCPECDKVLLDKSYLTRHVKIHSEEKNFECCICEKRFRTASSLKRHETTHNPSLRPHACPECGKRFPDISGIRKHAKTHERVKTHICIICAKGFSHAGDLNTHLRYHDIEKQFRCEDCGKEFARNNNLLRHRAVHAENGKYKCTVCNVSFQHAATLTRHILASHPEEVNVRTKKAPSKESKLSTQDRKKDVPSDETSEAKVPEEDTQPTPQCVEVANEDPQPSAQCVNNPSEQITLVQSTPSSFEIYQIDASGSLVKVTDASATLQSLQLLGPNVQSSSDLMQVGTFNGA